MEVLEHPANQAGGTPAPNPEVEPRPIRRIYSARFKLQVLKETDAYLRRKGLYWSNLATWRQQREQGQLAGLSPRKRGLQPDELLERGLGRLQQRVLPAPQEHVEVALPGRAGVAPP